MFQKKDLVRGGKRKTETIWYPQWQNKKSVSSRRKWSPMLNTTQTHDTAGTEK